MNLNLKIYPIKTGEFIVSHINPLSHEIVRNRFKAKEKAQKHKEAIEYKYSHDGLSNLTEHTVENLMIKHFNDVQKCQIKRNKNILKDFLDTYGTFKIEDLNADVMELFFDQLYKENGYTSNYMCSVKSRFNSFFEYLRKQNIINNDPLEKCIYKVSYPRKYTSATISEEDVKELLEQAKKLSPGHLYPIIFTAYETGMHPNELYNLKWKHIDFKKKTIHIQDTHTRPRVIDLSDELYEIIDKLSRVSEYIFTTLTKKRLTATSIRWLIKEFHIKTSFKTRWCLTILRNSSAYHYIINGGNEWDLQKKLGHTNIRTTKDFVCNQKNKVSTPYDF